MRKIVVLSLVLLVAWSCGDDGPTDLLSPAPTDQEISDGSLIDGNPHFYFLPPLVKSPVFTGVFNPQLSPRVEICPMEHLVPAGDACEVHEAIATYTMIGGTGDELVRMSLTDEHYHVNWHTDVTGAVEGARYRVLVSITSFALGWADIEITTTGKEAKNLTDGGEVIGLVDGRTLPLIFRIEMGALGFATSGTDCPDPNECFEGTIDPNQGGTFVVPSEKAGFQVDATDIQNPAGGDIHLSIVKKELSADAKCDETYGGPQSGGCYVYEVIPNTVTFLDETGAPAGVMGICFDREKVTNEGWAIALGTHGVTTFPQGVAAGFLRCEEPSEDGAFILSSILKRFAGWLLPGPLYAVDEGEGGLVGSFGFSNGFWAIPIEIATEPADAFTGPYPAGQTMDPIAFSLTSAHHHATAIPIPTGVPVEFSVSEGGAVSPVSTVTSTGGFASTAWTLPTTAGLAAQITASVPDTDASATFTAGTFSPVLTNAEAQAVGVRWSSEKQKINNGFETTFTFRMSGADLDDISELVEDDNGVVIADNPVGGADGIAFVVQDHSPGAVGSGGGGIGYAGIPRSIAVEFDTWDNWQHPDPDRNHIAVTTNGTTQNSASHGSALGTKSLPVDTKNLSDGSVHTVTITYVTGAPGTLKVYLDGTEELSVSVDLTSIGGASILDGDGKAWIGFTSATGNAFEKHEILSWTFTSTP